MTPTATADSARPTSRATARTRRAARATARAGPCAARRTRPRRAAPDGQHDPAVGRRGSAAGRGGTVIAGARSALGGGAPSPRCRTSAWSTNAGRRPASGRRSAPRRSPTRRSACARARPACRAASRRRARSSPARGAASPPAVARRAPAGRPRPSASSGRLPAWTSQSSIRVSAAAGTVVARDDARHRRVDGGAQLARLAPGPPRAAGLAPSRRPAPASHAPRSDGVRSVSRGAATRSRSVLTRSSAGRPPSHPPALGTAARRGTRAVTP